MSGEGNGDPIPVWAGRRIAELESLVERLTAEIGSLRLQLDVLATLDPLSGLPNLAGVIDLVDAAARRLDRDGEPFGVMALEIGHLVAADRRHTGAVLAAALRRVDRPGWAGVGGFIVVLPGLVDSGVAAVVDRVVVVLGSPPDAPPREVRIALVLCGRRPAPEAFEVVEQARRLAAGAAPGEAVVVAAGEAAET